MKNYSKWKIGVLLISIALAITAQIFIQIKPTKKSSNKIVSTINTRCILVSN